MFTRSVQRHLAAIWAFRRRHTPPWFSIPDDPGRGCRACHSCSFPSFTSFVSLLSLWISCVYHDVSPSDRFVFVHVSWVASHASTPLPPCLLDPVACTPPQSSHVHVADGQGPSHGVGSRRGIGGSREGETKPCSFEEGPPSHCFGGFGCPPKRKTKGTHGRKDPLDPSRRKSILLEGRWEGVNIASDGEWGSEVGTASVENRKSNHTEDGVSPLSDHHATNVTQQCRCRGESPPYMCN